MTLNIFSSLESVLNDDLFPEVDVGLRSGRHYNLDGDVREYEFIQAAEEWLQGFYTRYGCRLAHGAEGYFYLLPDGALLGQKRLTAAEMLVGQTLALMRMDPAHLSRYGRIAEEKLLGTLENLLGSERLFALRAPRARGRDRETDAEKTREEVRRSLNGLQRLGFVERIAEGDLRHVIPRASVMRFADPVRGGEETWQALDRLVRMGEVAVGEPAEEEG